MPQLVRRNLTSSNTVKRDGATSGAEKATTAGTTTTAPVRRTILKQGTGTAAKAEETPKAKVQVEEPEAEEVDETEAAEEQVEAAPAKSTAKKAAAATEKKGKPLFGAKKVEEKPVAPNEGGLTTRDTLNRLFMQAVLEEEGLEFSSLEQASKVLSTAERLLVSVTDVSNLQFMGARFKLQGLAYKASPIPLKRYAEAGFCSLVEAGTSVYFRKPIGKVRSILGFTEVDEETGHTLFQAVVVTNKEDRDAEVEYQAVGEPVDVTGLLHKVKGVAKVDAIFEGLYDAVEAAKAELGLDE